MLRAAGPFAAFILGLTLVKALKHAGLASIIVGNAVGKYWQVLKEPYGILAIIVGSAAGLVTFVITTLIENSNSTNQAPPLDS